MRDDRGNTSAPQSVSTLPCRTCRFRTTLRRFCRKPMPPSSLHPFLAMISHVLDGR